MSIKVLSRLALCGGSLIAASTALAQDAATLPPAPTDADLEREIVVTGTQIQGAKINDVLPVTVIDEVDIANVAATSGDELFRAIPQAGGVAFNEQNDVTSNNARGDAASINLRDLGTGNTLLLINGRRMVLNPGFQTELLVPVVSPDTNEIAPGSVRRLEVLRDGASAIYGADAVAGVVNTVLRGNRKRGFIEGEYRDSDGTGLYSTQINGGYGFDFAGGRANLTVYGGYFYENGMRSDERPYSADDDKRPLVVGTPFEGDTQFNNRNTFGPFGQFDIQVTTNNNQTPIRDDDFYIQPSTFTGCRLDLGNGLCARNGDNPAVDVRYNRAFGTTLISEKTRINAAMLLNYEFSNNVEGYFEGTYYRSESSRNITPAAILSAVPVGISRNAYWNPFGPVTFPGGAPNPNRLPGLTIPAGGLDVIMERYRFVDAGNRTVDVDKDSYRFVAGLRGNFGAWDFDTGFVYSEARATDLEGNRVSLTLLQQALNRSTPDAYNPFNGGCLDNPANGDCTPNPASSIDPFRISVFRKGGTSLALADFKVSNSGLVGLPGGDVGVAAGIEWRRETFFDDRDPRIDGTITWTDSVTGVFDGSDVVGTSASPDTSGVRDVWSAFVETFVPLVSEDMEIPMINSLNLQLAGRMEHFRDIDETAIVPRAAASWSVVPGLMLRGAWSRGFRAPNLVQVNDEGTTRSNTRDDFVRCQAQVEKGLLANLGICPGEGVISFRSGTDNLTPEKSESINLGLVFEPIVIPGLTFTADFWRVRQNGLVGVFGDDNAIALDLLLRQNGSSNPNVIRAAPTQEQIDLYQGTSLAAAGDIIRVLDPYLNLDSRISKGWDFGLSYNVPEFGIGKFRLRVNAARLESFVQSAGEDGQTLLDAVTSGELPPEVRIEGLGQLLELDGRPKWRLSGSVNWGSGPVDLGIFAQYVGEVWNTSVSRDVPVVSDDPNANFWRVNDFLTINTTISYTFKNKGPLDGTRIRLGVNNILDRQPPLADETYGFLSALHSPRGRVFRAEVRKTF